MNKLAKVLVILLCLCLVTGCNSRQKLLSDEKKLTSKESDNGSKKTLFGKMVIDGSSILTILACSTLLPMTVKAVYFIMPCLDKMQKIITFAFVAYIVKELLYFSRVAPFCGLDCIPCDILARGKPVPQEWRDYSAKPSVKPIPDSLKKARDLYVRFGPVEYDMETGKVIYDGANKPYCIINGKKLFFSDLFPGKVIPSDIPRECLLWFYSREDVMRDPQSLVDRATLFVKRLIFELKGKPRSLLEAEKLYEIEKRLIMR
jgi:hypothetical protein